MKPAKEGAFVAVILAATVLTATILTGCMPAVGPAVGDIAIAARAAGGGGRGGGGGEGGGKIEVAGNNLSYPVLWADDPMPSFATVDGGSRTAAVTLLEGPWCYWLGLTADGDPIVVLPDPENPDLVPAGAQFKAFEQQDFGNVWTADAKTWAEYNNVPAGADAPVLEVSSIDWGDNLESLDWSVRSKVRTEVVLFKDVTTPLVGYDMLHIRDLGIDEMHGLKFGLYDPTTPDPITGAIASVAGKIDVIQPIVYSNHARLTIQKLKVPRTDPRVIPDSGNYELQWVWDPVGLKGYWTETGSDDLIDESTIFNEAVYNDVEDGPGGYSAEVNVKGRIVYGYTWDPRNSAVPIEEGYYRLTFSLDPGSNAELRGASIVLPVETETEVTITAGDETNNETGGATAVVSKTYNLTYMDIFLTAAGGGGKKN